MRPLKVTAVMADGRVASIDGRLYLDSILAFSWMLEHHGDRVLFDFAATNGIIDPDLSGALEKRGEGDDWYWACSQGVFDQRSEHIEFKHKRIHVMAAERYVDFQGQRGKIVTAGGPYKNWRVPIVVRLVPEVVWYCVGDPDEIRRLLDYITHIGAQRRSGYGLVKEWRVEPWEHDWSEYGPEGELMRPLPDPEGTEETGIRPPYWSATNWRVCRVPEAENVARRVARGV